ncbi:uncharacterized protein LY89DRAFT_692158 [Mollisia scopiformis]|uniref:DUF7702 domain-containing protein n=1 Tax=Mollisia scopiformis TaxID=149040 RepID=A0A132B325_MOLSC|nr:uncharacterized protein LY89DRAFT_692158 [Mollisia scopiformis]KUJ06796.1 hypothetical protein LY89DRAFT_692158 [Mollisia scopiformis]
MTQNSLPSATCVIYVILIVPITFCLFKHGRHGILGWLTIQLFCGLRIVGSLIEIHQNNTHSTDTTTTLILNNIGLSPLLLAALGVLHEARTARNPKLNTRLEWIKVLSFHSVVVGGMVFIIIGIIHEIDNKTTTPPTLSKLGIVILLLAWCVLAAWVGISLRKTDQSYEMIPLTTPHTREPVYGVPPAYAEATTLLYGVAIILPFIGIRDIYAALNIFLTSTTFKNSLVAKVILSVVPEAIMTTVLAGAGIMTRHMSKLRKVGKV